MNPLFVVAVAAGGFLLYEGTKANQKLEAARGKDQSRKPPLVSPHFSNMKENPFQLREKIYAESIQPSQRGLLMNPKMAGRWMITIPGGTMVPMHCSFNQLKRKVVLLLPEDQKKTEGIKHLYDNRYEVESPAALSNLFEQ